MFFEVYYETIYRNLAALGLCADLAFWHDTAFFIRLAWRGFMGSAVFGGKRIHVGAYEATILAYVYFRNSRELLFQG